MAPPPKPPLPPTNTSMSYKKKTFIVMTTSGIATHLCASPQTVSHASEVNSAATSCPVVEPTPKKRRGKTTETTSGTNPITAGIKPAPSTTASTAGPDTGFLVGPCMLGNHCFASTHELRKRCPGCNYLIHVLCGHVLKQMEGSKVNGKWIRYQADSVVCLACDPKTAGTSYTIADNDSELEEEDDAGTKESAHEDSGNNYDSEKEDDSENDGKKAEEKK
jgi:hypothetical protein